MQLKLTHFIVDVEGTSRLTQCPCHLYLYQQDDNVHVRDQSLACVIMLEPVLVHPADHEEHYLLY